MKVYILTKEYDYNGRLILDVYASREAAELERKHLGAMPQYIEDDLVIDERELIEEQPPGPGLSDEEIDQWMRERGSC